MSSAARSVAEAFVTARRERQAISKFPGAVPENLAAAYAVQDAALSIWDRDVVGWKVGRINAPLDTQLGADRLVGPILAGSIAEFAGTPVAMPVFHDGFAAAEAEFMLRLAVKDGAPLPTTNEDVFDWIDEVRIGIEIASSPYPGINDDGPCVTVADHGNNAGLLLGNMVDRASWGTLNDVVVSVASDGKEVGRATTATMLDGPFGAARFLLANLAQRGIAPRSGWWISSGAITGVHEILPGAIVTARFEGLGEIQTLIA
ncbi:2-keto-4-pentenoate hydratase [Croceicoccus ponticola]|uniref:2-keto-4-pentenoate hydratase n=1 Tax=Croceicoccus ponticola TaxID=2217664 RepID=A0A437GZM1_9SPHN|nr:2-keto-4-pentenoate hydratase [Croceicoccus ponticola]RVQ68795.1 2-keto-4-pentenoate hydratase [Croceicoccus ponticola]